MNILVTGGTGFIGSHTVVELLSAGHKVTVIDNLSNSSEDSLKRVAEICGVDSVPFIKCDIRDRATLSRVFESDAFDAVIHFAGLKAVGESVEMPLEYYDNNLGSTITLCEAMREHKVNKIIFSSSATVYTADNEMPLPFEEDTSSIVRTFGESIHGRFPVSDILDPLTVALLLSLFLLLKPGTAVIAAKVDFPLPVWPMMPTNCPASISSDMLSIATFSKGVP